MPAIVLKKFEARLRLLDHGLLTESHLIAQMQPYTREKESGGGGRMDVDGEEDEEKDETVPLETVEGFSRRIDDRVNRFISDSLMILDEGIADVGEGSSGGDDVKPEMMDRHARLRGRKSTGRDNYKDGLVYEERRTLLNEFGRKAYAKCSNCAA